MCYCTPWSPRVHTTPQWKILSTWEQQQWMHKRMSLWALFFHATPCSPLTMDFPKQLRNGKTFSRLPAKRATMMLSATQKASCPKCRTCMLNSVLNPSNRHWGSGHTLCGFHPLHAKWLSTSCPGPLSTIHPYPLNISCPGPLSALHPVSPSAHFPAFPSSHPHMLTVGKLIMSLRSALTCPSTGTSPSIGQSGLTRTPHAVHRVSGSSQMATCHYTVIHILSLWTCIFNFRHILVITNLALSLALSSIHTSVSLWQSLTNFIMSRLH